MLRRASRKDRNQTLVVKALRAAGVKVYVLNEPMDLLTGFNGVLRVIEIKDGERVPSQKKLKPSQQKFIEDFAGCPVFKVDTIGDAFRVHGIDVREV